MLFFNHGDLLSDKVAITVDDGWYADKVEQMVNQALKLKIHISAFPVGTVLQLNPKLWKDIDASGTELYNHTLEHRDLGSETIDKQDITRQLLGWEDVYGQVCKKYYINKVVRPPFGNGIDNRLFSVAQNLKYTGVAGWSIGSRGYVSALKPDVVFDEIKASISSGSIILLHFVDNDIAILPQIAELLEKKGLKTVPLSKLPGTPIFQEPETLSKNE